MRSFLKIIFLTAAIFASVACGSTQKGIEIVADEAQKKVDVMYNGKLFTSYIYPSDIEKPVLFPVYTSKGTVITRGFPLAPRPDENQDHPHQIGIWLTFGDVNGIDFWGNSYAIPEDEKPNYGSVRHRSIISAQSGVSQGVLEVTADWVDHVEKIILKEETKFVFSGDDDLRIIERITKLTAMQDTATFTDNKEGMIAIRMDSAFEEPNNGVYRNSEGLEKGDVWGKPTKWVCLSAEKDGEKISVAIVDHKNNPGYPAYSHARGYGLFSTNNMGVQAFDEDATPFKLVLPPGKSLTFRHLIVVKTNGFASNEEINKIFTSFNL